MGRLEIFTAVMFALTTLTACLASPLSFVRQDATLFMFIFTLLEWERRRFGVGSRGAQRSEVERAGVRIFDFAFCAMLFLTLFRPMLTMTLAPACLGIIEGLFYLFSAVVVYRRRYVPGLASALLALVVGVRVLIVFWGREIPFRGVYVALGALGACALFIVMESGAGRLLKLGLAASDASSDDSPEPSLERERFLSRYGLETLTAVMFGLSAFLPVCLVSLTYFQKVALVYMFLYTLHEWEERRFPGGAVATLARLLGVEISEAQIRATSVPCYAALVVMTVVPLTTDSPVLTLVPIYFGLLEAAACLGVALAFKRIYFPGLATALALAVAGVWNLTIYARLRLVSGAGYFCAVVWLVVLLLCVLPFVLRAQKTAPGRSDVLSDSADRSLCEKTN